MPFQQKHLSFSESDRQDGRLSFDVGPMLVLAESEKIISLFESFVLGLVVVADAEALQTKFEQAEEAINQLTFDFTTLPSIHKGKVLELGKKIDVINKLLGKMGDKNALPN